MIMIILNLFELEPNNWVNLLFALFWLLVYCQYTLMSLAVLPALDFKRSQVFAFTSGTLKGD